VAAKLNPHFLVLLIPEISFVMPLGDAGGGNRRHDAKSGDEGRDWRGAVCTGTEDTLVLPHDVRG
jgi:hypothetical protein